MDLSKRKHGFIGALFFHLILRKSSYLHMSLFLIKICLEMTF